MSDAAPKYTAHAGIMAGAMTQYVSPSTNTSARSAASEAKRRQSPRRQVESQVRNAEHGLQGNESNNVYITNIYICGCIYYEGPKRFFGVSEWHELS